MSGAISFRPSFYLSPARTGRVLDTDRMLLFALVRAIEIIGEAASKVTLETRAAVPEVPWLQIVAMRNRLAHAYFDIDRNILWQTAIGRDPGASGTAAFDSV